MMGTSHLARLVALQAWRDDTAAISNTKMKQVVRFILSTFLPKASFAEVWKRHSGDDLVCHVLGTRRTLVRCYGR